MEIVWEITDTGHAVDVHGFGYDYTLVQFRIYADGYEDELQRMALEEWNEEGLYPTVIRSTSNEYITGMVLDSMCQMLEHYDCERYEDMPAGWHRIYKAD